MLTMQAFCQDSCSSVLRQAIESLNESALLLPLQLQHDVLLANVSPAGKILLKPMSGKELQGHNAVTQVAML